MRSVLGATLCSAMIALAVFSAPAVAQHPTRKACEDQWRALKAANQTTETQKAYVETCRAGTVATKPAPAAPAQAAPAAPAATTTTPPAAPAAQQPAPARPAARTPAATTAVPPAGSNQFADEAQAKARCPSDTVVWVNTDSKIYHFAGYSDYGKTKQGKFMCEREATAGGSRAAKNEKHP